MRARAHFSSALVAGGVPAARPLRSSSLRAGAARRPAFPGAGWLSTAAAHHEEWLLLERERNQQERATSPTLRGPLLPPARRPASRGRLAPLHKNFMAALVERKRCAQTLETAETARRMGFSLIRKLGEGAFGRVFLVHAHADGAQYAMKVVPCPSDLPQFASQEELLESNELRRAIRARVEELPPGLVRDHFMAADAALLDRLRSAAAELAAADEWHARVRKIHAEKEILMGLNSPFVSRLHRWFQHDSDLYMLMGYLDGASLGKRLKESGRFTEAFSRHVAAEMVLAIEYLHSQDVSHHDLKPDNIILSEAGHVTLTDFGLATKRKGGVKTFCGTPEYIAPEVLTEKKWASGPLDWWALGIMLYEMLAGRTPFAAQTAKDVFIRIITTSHVEYPPWFSPEAVDVINNVFLRRDVTSRPGVGPDTAGMAVVKAHPFFRGFDWMAAARKRNVSPPAFDEEPVAPRP